jgi:PKD repeat protein
MIRHVIAIAMVAVVPQTIVAQSAIVVPNGYATTAGNTSSTVPWSRNHSSVRAQLIYDSSNFTAQGAAFPIQVSRLRFRGGYGGSGQSNWIGGAFGNVTIDMSTAAVDYLSPSMWFDDNHGRDRVTVYTGPVQVQGGLFGPGLAPWFVDITLNTPFLYDPGSGNDLILDLSVDGNSWSGSSTDSTDLVSGTVTPPPRGSLIYSSPDMASPIGVIWINQAVVAEFTFARAPGLRPSFNATPRAGASPLLVQFTDQSYTDDPGGITSWAWDLDGDNIIDSTAQNPTHAYTACGTYTVSLTVTDATHAAQTLTRANLIVTDTVTPGFTWRMVAPRTLQFTDTSTPPATSWAWDFDGDHVIDSTVQNPTWTYPTGCIRAPKVALTVNRLCRGPFTITQQPFVADSIATRRDGTLQFNGSPVLGNFFDVTVLNPQGISVCMMEMKTTASYGQPVVFNVFVTSGTYANRHATPALWRQVASASTTGAPGANDLELASFNTPFYLPPGNFGVYVETLGGARPLLNPGVGLWSNADISITTGGSGILGGAYSQGNTWNGALHYGVCTVSGDAGYGFFGTGCAGSMDVPGNTASVLPRLNQTMTATLTRLPMNAAFALLGFSRTVSSSGPLPLDLTGFGAPGCFGRVSADSVMLVQGSGNAASFSVGVPNNAALLYMQFYTQGLALDPAANVLGAVTSDAAAAIIGL